MLQTKLAIEYDSGGCMDFDRDGQMKCKKNTQKHPIYVVQLFFPSLPLITYLLHSLSNHRFVVGLYGHSQGISPEPFAS